MNARTISPELLRATSPEGVDLLPASPLMLANNLPKTYRAHTPLGPDVVRHILRLILYLSDTSPPPILYPSDLLRGTNRMSRILLELF